MPWKLQDPGVNLTYVKTEQLPNGTTADILQLTFNAVGVTPENKYWLYVDRRPLNKAVYTIKILKIPSQSFEALE
jgi:hypothetical protein